MYFITGLCDEDDEASATQLIYFILPTYLYDRTFSNEREKMARNNKPKKKVCRTIIAYLHDFFSFITVLVSCRSPRILVGQTLDVISGAYTHYFIRTGYLNEKCYLYAYCSTCVPTTCMLG